MRICKQHSDSKGIGVLFFASMAVERRISVDNSHLSDYYYNANRIEIACDFDHLVGLKDSRCILEDVEMKRSLTLLLLLALCLSLAACGSQTPAPTAAPAATEAPAPAETPAEPEAPAEPAVEEPAALSLEGQTLLIYCGAGMQKPFQEIADAFQAETGCEMNVTYANAAQLQTQISESKQGAFFIAGSQEEVKPVADFVLDSTPLVKHIPVLAVAAGNPKEIKGIADLAREDVVTVIGDPESTPIGKIAMKAAGMESCTACPPV